MARTFDNYVCLKGTVYLKNAHYSGWGNKPYVDSKIVTSDAPLSWLLYTHDFFAVGIPAVELLAYIRAKNDEPVRARMVGSLVVRDGVSIVKAIEIDYFVSPHISMKAQDLLQRLRKGDAWLTANFKDSFDRTTQEHAAQLLANRRIPIPAE